MKHAVILFLFLSVFRSNLFAQIYKCKTIGIHIAHTVSGETEDVEFYAPVLIDINNKKIIISGKKSTVYAISSIDTSYVDVTRVRINEGNAINVNGIKCKFHCFFFAKDSNSVKSDGILGGLNILYKTTTYNYELHVEKKLPKLPRVPTLKSLSQMPTSASFEIIKTSPKRH